MDAAAGVCADAGLFGVGTGVLGPWTAKDWCIARCTQVQQSCWLIKRSHEIRYKLQVDMQIVSNHCSGVKCELADADPILTVPGLARSSEASGEVSRLGLPRSVAASPPGANGLPEPGVFGSVPVTPSRDGKMCELFTVSGNP